MAVYIDPRTALALAGNARADQLLEVAGPSGKKVLRAAEPQSGDDAVCSPTAPGGKRP